MVLVTDGWLEEYGMEEHGRSMEAVETRSDVFCMVVGGALHGGSSTWWLSFLLAQPGEAAQLMARWGPLERGGSVDSCAQHAGLVYMARLHGWWSRLHGGMVDDLQK
uniref:Uncharacterized protein n=1 Tax=Meloidogyne javanica TaxID=6303 RepID=A0A915MB09_MELJA